MNETATTNVAINEFPLYVHMFMQYPVTCCREHSQVSQQFQEILDAAVKEVSSLPNR